MATIEKRLDDLEEENNPKVYPMYWVERPNGSYVKFSDGRRVDPSEVPPEQLAKCKYYRDISPDDWDDPA